MTKKQEVDIKEEEKEAGDLMLDFIQRTMK